MIRGYWNKSTHIVTLLIRVLAFVLRFLGDWTGQKQARECAGLVLFALLLLLSGNPGEVEAVLGRFSIDVGPTLETTLVNTASGFTTTEIVDGLTLDFDVIGIADSGVVLLFWGIGLFVLTFQWTYVWRFEAVDMNRPMRLPEHGRHHASLFWL